MSGVLRVEALFARLRTAEWTARAQLVSGCADDVAKIERLLERPLERAREEAHNFAASFGAMLDDELGRSLRNDAFLSIGMTCAQAVFANADLRAHARFRIYAGALRTGEADIAARIAATRLVPPKRPLPRMFAIAHLDFDERVLPGAPESDSEISDWIVRLRTSICDELMARIDVALSRVLACGLERLAAVKTRLDLVSYERA